MRMLRFLCYYRKQLGNLIDPYYSQHDVKGAIKKMIGYGYKYNHIWGEYDSETTQLQTRYLVKLTYGEKGLKEFDSTEWVRNDKFAFKKYKNISLGIVYNSWHCIQFNQPKSFYEFVKNNID